jgi:hypothetical protein
MYILIYVDDIIIIINSSSLATNRLLHLSIPYRPGTPAYQLQVESRGRV